MKEREGFTKVFKTMEAEIKAKMITHTQSIYSQGVNDGLKKALNIIRRFR